MDRLPNVIQAKILSYIPAHNVTTSTLLSMKKLLQHYCMRNVSISLYDVDGNKHKVATILRPKHPQLKERTQELLEAYHVVPSIPGEVGAVFAPNDTVLPCSLVPSDNDLPRRIKEALDTVGGIAFAYNKISVGWEVVGYHGYIKTNKCYSHAQLPLEGPESLAQHIAYSYVYNRV